MITILPADDAFYAAHGMTDKNLRAMVIAGGDTVTEYIVFALNGKEMELLEMYTDDFVIEEGLVRAALNYGFRRAAETAFCTASRFDAILKFLVFKDVDERKEVSLNEFFSRGCKHCKKM